MASLTPNFSFSMPDVGGDDFAWGTMLNANWSDLDGVLKAHETATAASAVKITALENRVLTAGTGLTGGGNLTADREFRVAYGTAAGTAAQGNDARLSNAREWTATTVTKAEAEAGTASTRRAWTAVRVKDAILKNINDLGLKALATKDKAAIDTDTTGTLPLARGGTGATTAAAARNNLGLAGLATKDKAAIDTDTTGTLPLARGGTGATTADGALVNLGIGGIGLGKHNDLRGTWAEGTPADYYGKGFAVGLMSANTVGVPGGGAGTLFANGQWPNSGGGAAISRLFIGNGGVFASRRDTDSTWTPWRQLDLQPLGEGQSWSNVRTSRALNTSYQNTTGRSIAVAVKFDWPAQVLQVSHDGASWVTMANGDATSTVTVVIPPGHYYRMQGNDYSQVRNWVELR